jgi:hypothetical protein
MKGNFRLKLIFCLPPPPPRFSAPVLLKIEDDLLIVVESLPGLHEGKLPAEADLLLTATAPIQCPGTSAK